MPETGIEDVQGATSDAVMVVRLDHAVRAAGSRSIDDEEGPCMRLTLDVCEGLNGRVLP